MASAINLVEYVEHTWRAGFYFVLLPSCWHVPAFAPNFARFEALLVSIISNACNISCDST